MISEVTYTNTIKQFFKQIKTKVMTRFFKRLNGLWNDKRAEFSNEVSHKEKQAIIAETAKNEQVNDLSVF